MIESATRSACPCCQETQEETQLYCLGCNQWCCLKCAEIRSAPLAPIYVCLECQVDELGESFTTDNAKQSATVRKFCKGLARGARVVEETGTPERQQ